MVNNMALFQLFGDVFYGNAKFNHQNHHMVGKVADLVNGFLFVALAACNDHFGGFLTDLFQNLFQTLVKQVGGVAALFGVGLAAFDQLIQPLPGELLQLIGNIDRVKEAAFRAGVAGGAALDDPRPKRPYRSLR